MDRDLSFQENLRLRLATLDDLPRLALLGLICGVVTGGVIVLFRASIDTMQMLSTLGASVASLSPLSRLILATLGGLVVGVLMQFVAGEARQVGIVHVMERLAYFQGRLPWTNAVWQFIGATLSIAAGHSVGREGPGVHLGAASASVIGQWLDVPHNSLRILVACGVAAAIAASFNTPLAGVIFSMEAVMMEYTIAGFAPVILAAVSATTVARMVFGDSPAFDVPPLHIGSLFELPYMVAIGLLIGALAAALVHMLRGIDRKGQSYPLWQRTTVAGLVVGICAWQLPQITGVGYDTVHASLAGEIGIGLGLAIAVVKLFATATSIGLSIPGGIIGPTLVIGATAGSSLGLLAAQWLPTHVSSASFYAMLGMGAMMGATLQAPLAALTALVELTSNPAIILPGMLAVITADLTSSELFRTPPALLMLARARGLDYRNDPVAQSLRRIGVTRVMNRSLVVAAPRLTEAETENLLHSKPQWVVVRCDGDPTTVLPAADLATYLREVQLAEQRPETIDLLEIPAQRRDVIVIDVRANLQEALDALADDPTQVLCVAHRARGRLRVLGIATTHDIELQYTYRPPMR